MSYTAGELVACPNIQDRLDANFETCDQSKVREAMPLFEFIMSPANRGNLQQKMSPGRGKIRSVDLVYDQRFLESQVSSNQTNPTCTATEFAIDNSTNYTIDTDVNEQVKFKFDIADMLNSCRDNANYMTDLMQRMIDALVRKVATKTTTQVAALSGKWADNVTVTNDQLIVKTRIDSTVNPYPQTLQTIKTAARKTGYCAPYAVFSGSTLYDYIEYIQSGCCADYGIDLSSMFARFGLAAAYDMRVADAMSEDEALMIQQGALQMVTFNLFDGQSGINQVITENYSQRVITDPMTGLPIDLVIKVDCGTIHIIMTATTKVFGMPSDMFQIGDRLRGVNFVNEINVVNV